MKPKEVYRGVGTVLVGIGIGIPLVPVVTIFLSAAMAGAAEGAGMLISFFFVLLGRMMLLTSGGCVALGIIFLLLARDKKIS